MRQDMQHRADWQECDAGTIQQLGDRLRGRRRARSVQRWTVAGMSVAGFAFVALLWASGGRQSAAIPPMVCRDVERMAQRYVDGTLSAAMMARISRHLDACPKCRTRVERLQDDTENATSGSDARATRLRQWLRQTAVARL